MSAERAPREQRLLVSRGAAVFFFHQAHTLSIGARSFPGTRRNMARPVLSAMSRESIFGYGLGTLRSASIARRRTAHRPLVELGPDDGARKRGRQLRETGDSSALPYHQDIDLPGPNGRHAKSEIVTMAMRGPDKAV